jgi:hypothetical protein
MAAAEVKTVTLFALLSSALGTVAAEYSLVLAGAIIGGAISLSTGPRTTGVLASLRSFLAGVGCALLFTLPLSALASGLTMTWLQLPREELIAAVAGLIGLFWQRGLRLLGAAGEKWANKLGGVDAGHE